jgi:hypothetical protein
MEGVGIYWGVGMVIKDSRTMGVGFAAEDDQLG